MCGANTSEKRDASEDSRVRLMIQTLIECHLQILSVFQLPGVQDQYRVWYVPVTVLSRFCMFACGAARPCQEETEQIREATLE